MDETKLNPCPFCGEVPILIGHGMSSGDSIFWVRCCGCGVSTTLLTERLKSSTRNTGSIMTAWTR